MAEDDHPHTELNALRSATPVIHTLYSSHVELVLSYFTMTESLAAELRALAARGWGHMSLTGLEWPSDTALTTRLPPLQTLGLGSRLTDARLGLMQACVSSAKALKVSGVASLSTAIEAGVRLPWESIRLDSCPVGELVGAAPLVGEAAWDVGTLDIVLTKEQVCVHTHTYHPCVHARMHATLYLCLFNSSYVCPFRTSTRPAYNDIHTSCNHHVCVCVRVCVRVCVCVCVRRSTPVRPLRSLSSCVVCDSPRWTHCV